MTVKQRLMEFIRHLNISSREFCRNVGVSQTYVSSMRSSLQPDKLLRIIKKYPELNPDWLMTGNGEMIRKVPHTLMSDRERIVEIGADVFRDKLLQLFKSGEVVSASVVVEQQRVIFELQKRVEALVRENERLKMRLGECES